jgi:hypothetical protein
MGIGGSGGDRKALYLDGLPSLSLNERRRTIPGGGIGLRIR